VDTVLVFHNIGLDRLVNSYRNPALVDRAVTYVSCPNTRHVMDLDNITNSVVVTSGGSLTFQNMIMQVMTAGIRSTLQQAGRVGGRHGVDGTHAAGVIDSTAGAVVGRAAVKV
jgi:hypothetical protein